MSHAASRLVHRARKNRRQRSAPHQFSPALPDQPGSGPSQWVDLFIVVLDALTGITGFIDYVDWAMMLTTKAAYMPRYWTKKHCQSHSGRQSTPDGKFREPANRFWPMPTTSKQLAAACNAQA